MARERRARRNLRLIALVFFVVGMLVVLMVANTPLSADEDFRGTDRGALNVLTAVAAVLAVAALVVPWRRLPRDAFFAVPAAGAVLISVCSYYAEG